MANSKMKMIQTVPAKNVFFAEKTVKMENTPESCENAVINVFDDVVYQSVLGFGGAFTESAGYNYSMMDEKTKQEFIQLYFDPEKGISYNFGRAHINSCDFSLDIYDYVEKGDKTLETFSIERDKKYIIPLIRDAMKACSDELVLFASPWSPPAYMKDNHNMTGGGSLLEEYKKIWALYYAKYIKAYAQEGIKISAISIQNEPIAKQTWESCYYTPEDEKTFIRDYLIPVLDEEGLSDIKLIIWDHNKERVYDRAKHILSDETVNNRVWAVGHHWYSGDHFDGLRLVHEQLRKPLICTEFCATLETLLPEDTIPVAERYAVEMCENFNNFEIASCDWNILLSQNGGPYHNRTKASAAVKGVVYDVTEGGCLAPILYHQAEKRMVVTPLYYYIGHFSKFVRRGAKRIAVTKYTDKLHVCAFVNPDGSKVVIVINVSDLDLPAVIRYHGGCTEVKTKAHSIATLIF